MPIGKISNTAGKGADYSAGSQNIQHTVQQSKSSFSKRQLPLAVGPGFGKF